MATKTGMLEIRRAEDRGHFEHDWLSTYHTFSFGTYHDRARMGFRTLRVINEDRVSPGRGFAMHPHKDMEIITYVVRGALQHRDSTGNGAVVRAGEVQRMTAGTGVMHSEMNASDREEVHLFQIWILPERLGLQPSYEQRTAWMIKDETGLDVLASHGGEKGGMVLHQDAIVFLGRTDAGKRVRYELPSDRDGWIQVISGGVMLNGLGLRPGDGASVTDTQQLELTSELPAEFLLFDLH